MHQQHFLECFPRKGREEKTPPAPKYSARNNGFFYIKFVNYTRCPCKKLKWFRAEGWLKILPSLVLGKAYLPVMDLLSALSHPSGRTKRLHGQNAFSRSFSEAVVRFSSGDHSRNKGNLSVTEPR